ncbi:MAG: SpoVA/SpoVAEb family sporulation membrane protein, partial [Halanaerobiales bacterium]
MKHINKTGDEYKEVIKKSQPPPRKLVKFIRAFVVGGVFCVIGQGFWQLYLTFNLSHNDAGVLSTITMIFLGGLLT